MLSRNHSFEHVAQIAAVGGNQRGRTFFKQHGWTELGSDKIEQKVIAAPHATCSICWPF